MRTRTAAGAAGRVEGATRRTTPGASPIDGPRMNMGELADKLGLPARVVRHLVAERVIGPATERGRGAEGFGPTHLADGRRYAELAAAQPGGRISPHLARAMLGFPHGRAVSDIVPRDADFGPFAAMASEEVLATATGAAIEDAIARLRLWLHAVRDEARAPRNPATHPDTERH